MSQQENVHLIEEDEVNDLVTSPESKTSIDHECATYVEAGDASLCYGQSLAHDFHEALEQFERSSEFCRAVATALIAKESALVNNRLLSVQKRVYQCAATDVSSGEERPKKRSRVDLKIEQDSLWNRTLRARRMSMLLQTFETQQQLLLDELMACADDADLSEQQR